MTEEEFEKFRDDHAVRDDVWESQFERFTTAERARGLYAEDALAQNQRTELSKMLNWMTGKMGKAINPNPGGLIIHRTPIPGATSITPELRPNEPMPGRKRVHYHGDDQRPETLALLRWNGKPLHEIQIETPKQARFHIVGKKHDKVNDQHVHEHQPPKKYVFLAAPVGHYGRSHTHRWLHTQGTLVSHLEKRHRGEPAPGLDDEHEHQYTRKGRGDAARIDLNGFALELLEGAEEVFLGFEGSIKAASMLSEILDTGRKASVASAPSVTLWLAGPDQDELEILVRRYALAGKRVYIVTDADGIGGGLDGRGNPNVRAQALFARDYLRHLGVRAWIVAPPYDPDNLDQKGKPVLNGVDDFRAAGGTLDDLVALQREPRPTEEIVKWLKGVGYPDDLALFRAAFKIQSLSLFPSQNPLKTTTRILGVEKKRQAVSDLDEFARCGAITISEGSTSLGMFYGRRPVPEEWANHEDEWRRGIFRQATLEWTDPPRYKFAPGLEAIEGDPVSVRELDAIPYEEEPLQEVKLVKAGPVDKILALAADKSRQSAREVLKSIGMTPAQVGTHPDDGEPLVWAWVGEGDPTRKDVRDWLILYLALAERFKPEDIAPIFDLSIKQVERLLGYDEIRARRKAAMSRAFKRFMELPLARRMEAPELMRQFEDEEREKDAAEVVIPVLRNWAVGRH